MIKEIRIDDEEQKIPREIVIKVKTNLTQFFLRSDILMLIPFSDSNSDQISTLRCNQFNDNIVNGHLMTYFSLLKVNAFKINRKTL